jgi:hypothetical protein
MICTYEDSDRLKWEHSYQRTLQEDELIGFGSNGEKILVIELQNFR